MKTLFEDLHKAFESRVRLGIMSALAVNDILDFNALKEYLDVTDGNLALNVFTIGQEKNEEIPVSTLNENNIYRFCGISIIILMLLVPVSEMLKVFKYSTLVLEAFALFLFGAAWLIKGRALGDEGKMGEKLYREHNVEDTEKDSD